MKKFFLFIISAILSISVASIAYAVTNENIAPAHTAYYKDGCIVTINVINYRRGGYECVRIMTAQYHENNDYGFIHIGTTGQTMKIKPNPYYGEVNDIRANYKYVAGDNYYLVNP